MNQEMHGEVFACIRPEDVTLHKAGSELHTSARNVFGARITKIHNLGGIYKIFLHTGFNLVSMVTKQALEDLDLKEQDQVCITFKASSVHVINR